MDAGKLMAPKVIPKEVKIIKEDAEPDMGAVGMTGLATGPHLDYRMVRKGVFVDPLKIQSPPADPLPAGERPAFERACAERLALLAADPVRTARAAP